MHYALKLSGLAVDSPIGVGMSLSSRKAPIYKEDEMESLAVVLSACFLFMVVGFVLGLILE